MRFVLLIATISVAIADDSKAKVDVNEELKPEESVHMGDEGHSFSDGLELMRHREQRNHAEHYHVTGRDPNHDLPMSHDHPASRGLDAHDLPGPVILRSPGPLPHNAHPDIRAQNKIIADVFSPDYYQPTWVLDYRYLKTGGRDYTRGPGGQILILPKGVRSKEPKEFPDYDAYLEHLRLSRLSERQHHRHGYDRDYNRGYWQHSAHDNVRHEDHGHGQTVWHKYG